MHVPPGQLLQFLLGEVVTVTVAAVAQVTVVVEVGVEVEHMFNVSMYKCTNVL